MDIPRLRGVDYLEPATAIYTEDLEAWENRIGTRVRPGDVVFIRTGRWARRAKLGPWDAGQGSAVRTGLEQEVIAARGLLAVYADVARDTLRFMRQELWDDQGAFIASLSSDDELSAFRDWGLF